MAAAGSDDFADAPPIGTDDVSDPTDAQFFTLEAGERMGDQFYNTSTGAPYVSRSAWWYIEPFSDGWVQIDTDLSTGEPYVDSSLVVWADADGTMAGLVDIAEDDDSGSTNSGRSSMLVAYLYAGIRYYVQVGDYYDLDVLSYVLQTQSITSSDPIPPPPFPPRILPKLNTIVEIDAPQSLLVITPPEIVLTVLTPVLNQAPGMIGVTIAGGIALDFVTVAIDGNDVIVVQLNSDGNFGPFSVPVDNVLGTKGDHTLTATGGATATFTITLDPPIEPVTPDPDAPPTVVPAAVEKWVFQDPVPVASGGIGEWIMPFNPWPDRTTSPFPVKSFASRAVTANVGRWHIFQGQTPPKEWQFGGYLPTQEMVDRLLEFRDLNRRFYIIDNRNRAWMVILTYVEIVPRLRHTWVTRGEDPIENNDWGHDYTVTAMILDPDWKVPT